MSAPVRYRKFMRLAVAAAIAERPVVRSFWIWRAVRLRLRARRKNRAG